MSKFPGFGSVSEGTLRDEDLLEAFGSTLEIHDPKAYRKIWREYSKDGEWEMEYSSEIIDKMQEALNELAPDFVYFGSGVGDGALFGYWVDWEGVTEAVRSGEVVEVSDTSLAPKYSKNGPKLVLHVSDHGNGTLYRITSRGLREIWSVV